ncbi:MAG: DNA repair protein RadA [Lachnospiraceae bacterium]|jgi:DNA repair protein RadA/Sms|nr:DNA repair protein RadA [Lachnospiraceae bacterium]MEE3460783.1 DNA repair protein RadA [Lachnospiraceae bacterium]
MAKKSIKSVFFCKECGFESSKWLGQCPQCKAWDSFAEEKVVSDSVHHTGSLYNEKVKPLQLGKIESVSEGRMTTHIGELDRVLGGGIVMGSLVLVGGDPGIGKSTLLLQMCFNLVKDGIKVLYVSGEESARQLKMRADRIPDAPSDLAVLSDNDLMNVEDVIRTTLPQVVIIDSIQTMLSPDLDQAPGSISQVRKSTGILMKLAKTLPVTIFIVGHVTKDGQVAGPRVLEHMVDTVLYFETDAGASYRFLRAVKNRFGSTNEVGVFEMNAQGLREVPNPSEYMLAGRPQNESGSAIACTMEGTRPILIEVQALVCRTSFNLPRRTAAGTDYNRVNLLMAVIEKRLDLHLGECDCYINIAGGLKVSEPSLDLAIVYACVSSYRGTAIDPKSVIFGEVGLTGEVRAVTNAEQRIAEAAKLGFEEVILPKANLDRLDDEKKSRFNITLKGIDNIRQLF